MTSFVRGGALDTVLMRPKFSIARSVSRWLLFGSGGLIFIAGLIVLNLVERQLVALFDDSLIARAQALAAMVEYEPDRDTLEIDVPSGLMLSYSADHHAGYFELVDTGGNRIGASPSLGQSRLIDVGQIDSSLMIRDVALPDSRAGRLLLTRFAARIDGPDEDGVEERSGASATSPAMIGPAAEAVLAVAIEREPLDALISRLRLTAIATILLIIGGLMLVSRWSVAQGLRPVDDIRRQISRLDAQNPVGRIQPHEPCEEMQAIVDQINSLLERLQSTLAHERQFSRDVAHELRTPLSELRTMADVAQRWPDDSRLRDSFFVDAAQAIEHMDVVLTNLLALARSERGIEVVESKPFDLNELTQLQIDRYRDRAAARDVGLIAEGLCVCELPGGQDQWVQILRNLIGNAVDHAAPESIVLIRLRASSDRFEWSIDNATVNLTSDDIPHLFDRLWRKETGSAAGEHVGLGLALVRTLSRQLGLTLNATLAEDKRLCLSLNGPRTLSQKAAMFQIPGKYAS